MEQKNPVPPHDPWKEAEDAATAAGSGQQQPQLAATVAPLPEMSTKQQYEYLEVTHKREVFGVSSVPTSTPLGRMTDQTIIRAPKHPLPHISTWTDEFEKAFVCRNARYEGDVFTSDEEDHEYYKCWPTRLRTKETQQRPCRYIVKRFINNDMPNGVVYNLTFSETLVTYWAGQPSAKFCVVLDVRQPSRIDGSKPSFEGVQERDVGVFG